MNLERIYLLSKLLVCLIFKLFPVWVEAMFGVGLFGEFLVSQILRGGAIFIVLTKRCLICDHIG